MADIEFGGGARLTTEPPAEVSSEIQRVLEAFGMCAIAAGGKYDVTLSAMAIFLGRMVGANIKPEHVETHLDMLFHCMRMSAAQAQALNIDKKEMN